MGKKAKPLEDCRTADDFLRVVRADPDAVVRNGKGSHCIVEKPGRACAAVIPRHDGDLPTGTRCAIRRALAALGIGVLVLVSFACIVAQVAALAA